MKAALTIYIRSRLTFMHVKSVKTKTVAVMLMRDKQADGQPSDRCITLTAL